MTRIIISGDSAGRYRQEVSIGRHRLVADEPESLGGDDAGPAPMEFVLTGLGACTAITLCMYAERKNLDIRRITVSLEHRQTLVDDKIRHVVERHIALEGELTQEQRARLLEIANRCPTLLALQQPLQVETQLETVCSS